MKRERTLVAAAVALGLVVRVLRLARDPLLHPDGPAYLGLATALLEGHVRRVLGGYYSPLYPATVAGVAAAGAPLELAGRVAALVAGLAALPLLYAVARRMLGVRAAAAAVLVAAVQPELVKASVQVLPETLAGAVVLLWLLAVRRTVTGAGMLAGAAYLVRPEGLMLIPLGAWRLRGRGARAVVVYATAAIVVMLPALVALHAESGRWQLTPREARIAERTGIPGATTLAGAVARAPGRMAGLFGRGLGAQVLHDAKALSPLLVVPLAAGLASPAVRAAAGWPFAVAATITVFPLALNPSPRYAVPLVPLLLVPVAGGLVVLGQRLGKHRAPAAAAALGIALVVQALWLSHPADAVCSREVVQLILSRYGPGEALVAVDGRFAYGARGRALVPTANDPATALALARRHGARLWLTRPRWIPKAWTMPLDVHPVAHPCDGTFTLYEIARPEADVSGRDGTRE